MFEISSVAGEAGRLFGQANAARDNIGGILSEIVNQAQLDPTALENLSLDHVGQWLAEAGFDPSALTQGQVAEIVRQVGEGAAVDGLDVSTVLNEGEGK